MGKKKKPAPRLVAAKDSQSTRAGTTSPEKPVGVEHIGGAVEAGQRELPVVGIGASAGGLDAFQRLFAAMPADTGMAFVLIQHLAPTHESLTAELLGRHAGMPVVQVVDEMAVEPNHVYVIPPNRYLTISAQTLHLTEPIERRGLRVPIDFFFRSLAEEQHERAIGIILSGTGTDGTLGVREIKAAGGMVMVQRPETTQFDGMLRSAVGSGVVDYVLPIEEMPQVLIRYIQHWYVNGECAPSLATETAPDHLKTIVGLLRTRMKYDFSCYKKGTLTRRVQRRMGLSHIEGMSEYVQLLRQKEEEITALYKDLLIGVTNFFREPPSWLALAEHVLSPLVDEHDGDSAIRVWVPGCATGEEPYSLAILLAEQLQASDKRCDIQIFASDIDQDALGFARAGIYPESVAANITAQRLRGFFIKGEHTYRVNKEIREAVVFAEQNLICDPPFSKLDLISCRNLLIYLEPEVQQRILSLFHFALREGGHLFLGGSETVGQQHDLFETVSRKWRIYRRIGPTRHDTVDFPARTADALHGIPERSSGGNEVRGGGVKTLAQQLVLQRFAPACVLINRKAEVLYLNGPIDHYLQLPIGELAPDVVAMAREGLRTKLRAAVRQAIRDKQLVAISDLRVRRDRRYHRVHLTVEPLHQPRQAEGLLLVVFEEEADAGRNGGLAAPPDTERVTDADYNTAEGIPSGHDDQQATVRQLEEELRTTRQDLQATIEELETSNEEFKAAHEEVTSVNEELQSTNEELETSKEELQSLNEELQTVNAQLEQKIVELESTNNDLQNLLASTEIATVFLDRRFRIKRFTPVTTRLFRLIETDVGRPVSDIAHNFHDEDLLTDAESVLEQLTPIERQVETEDGHSYVRRIMPYRTEDNRIDGVVLTFVDVTERAAAEREIQEARQYAEGIVETVREPLLVLDAELRVRSANSAFYTSFQTIPRQTENRLIYELGDRQWDIPRLRVLLDEVLSKKQSFENFEVEHEFSVIGRRTMLLNARIFSRDRDHSSLILLAIEDITERAKAQESLKSLNEQLERRVAERTAEAENRARELADQHGLLRSILESTSDGIVAVDLSGKFLLFNPAGQRIIGSEPIDVPIEEWSAHFGLHWPDRFALCPTEDLPLVRAMRGEQVGEQQIYLCNQHSPDGIWLSVTAAPLLDEHRTPSGGMCIFRDVTEHRRADEARTRLAAILQFSPVGILVATLDGTIQHWNEGAKTLFGYSSQEVIGQSIRMLLPPEQADDFERIVARVGGGEPVQNCDTIRLHKNGERINVALTVTQLKDERGGAYGICSIVQDIRERKRLEQQLAQLADEERRMIGRELHDSLGQQITAMGMIATGLTHQLDGQSPQAETAAKLEMSVLEAQRMLRTLSKGLLPVAVDAHGLAAALESLASETVKLHEIECSFESAEPVPMVDNFVSTQLYLIAREAVHNAVKHGRPNRIVIELGNGDGIKLAVRDDGTGIVDTADEGSGMGLRIMRHRIGLINGTLQVEPSASGGTLVTCSLHPREDR
jgi:PAS domain S-box-containing protein